MPEAEFPLFAVLEVVPELELEVLEPELPDVVVVVVEEDCDPNPFELPLPLLPGPINC